MPQLDTPGAVLAWANTVSEDAVGPDHVRAAVYLAECVRLRQGLEMRQVLLGSVESLDDPAATTLEAHRVELGMLRRLMMRQVGWSAPPDDDTTGGDAPPQKENP